MSDGMRRELVYLSSHATNHYFIPNWGIVKKRGDTAKGCALCVCGAVPYIRRKCKAKSCKGEEKMF